MSSLVVILIFAGIVWAGVNFMNKITDESNPPSVIKKVVLGLPIIIGIAAYLVVQYRFCSRLVRVYLPNLLNFFLIIFFYKEVIKGVYNRNCN